MGSETSEVEATRISNHGFWLLPGGRESFLPFENFPWVQESAGVCNPECGVTNPQHLYWPDLDIDFAVDSIEHPERFPLIVKSNT